MPGTRSRRCRRTSASRSRGAKSMHTYDFRLVNYPLRLYSGVGAL